jgi:hypothetical protein
MMDLAFLHHRSRAVRDAEFFPALELFLLAERGIFDGAVARGKGAAVSAVNRPVSLQDIEILADRNLGRFEVAGEFGDQNPALTAQQINYGAASFFVQHGNVLPAAGAVGRRTALVFRMSFYSVSFRLSTER